MRTQKLPTSSIVIVNYNGGPLVSQCIESIRKYSRDYEIILVDNASTDNSLALTNPGPDLRVFKLLSNVGFANANNLGIKKSSGRYVLLVNSDTVVTRNWLDLLIKKAEEDPRIGLVTPKLLRPGNPTLLDSTGLLYHYRTAMCGDRGQGEIDRGQYDQLTELTSCGFACALVKRGLFAEIGLLDGKMFFYFEDLDFCLRARLAGWRVVFCPESTVYHLRGASTRSENRIQVGNRSRGYPLRIILKSYQAKHVLLFGTSSFLILLVRVLAGLKNRDWSYAKNNLVAALWNIAHYPIKERIKIQRLRRISDRSLFTAEPRSQL